MKIFSAILLAVALLFSNFSFAQVASSKVLLGKLQDAQQLLKTGVSYNEFKPTITEIKLALGRFEKELGPTGVDSASKFSIFYSSLSKASTKYIGSMRWWNSAIEDKVKYPDNPDIARMSEIARDGIFEDASQLVTQAEEALSKIKQKR